MSLAISRYQKEKVNMAKKNADDSSNESNVDFESALKELENLV